MHNEEEGKKGEAEEETLFRWLDLVRYAAAAVVASLAVAVLVGAILEVLRPDELDISVAHGSVVAEAQPPRRPKSIKLTIHLFASNPSGRAAISFVDVLITIGADGNDVPMHTRRNFSIPLVDFPTTAPQQTIERLSVQSTKAPMEILGGYFISKLADGKSVAVTMLVQGTRKTQVGTLNGGRVSTTQHKVTYTCLGITLGVDRSLNSTGDNVHCINKGSNN